MNHHPHYIFWTTRPEQDTVCGIPYSFGPDSFVEPGVNAHILSSHLLHSKFPYLFECTKGKLLETHSMDVLVDVDGVLSGHYLADGRMALLLATLLCGSHYAGPRLERKNTRYCGRGKAGSFQKRLPFPC